MSKKKSASQGYLEMALATAIDAVNDILTDKTITLEQCTELLEQIRFHVESAHEGLLEDMENTQK